MVIQAVQMEIDEDLQNVFGVCSFGKHRKGLELSDAKLAAPAPLQRCPLTASFVQLSLHSNLNSIHFSFLSMLSISIHREFQL